MPNGLAVQPSKGKADRGRQSHIKISDYLIPQHLDCSFQAWASRNVIFSLLNNATCLCYLNKLQVVLFRVVSADISAVLWSYTGKVSGVLHVHYFPDT